MPTSRLSIAAILILTLALAAAFATIRLSVQQFNLLRANAHEHAEQIAHTVAQLAHYEVAANDRVALAYRLEGFTHFKAVQAIVVLDRREALLAAATRNPAGNLAATPQLPFELKRQQLGTSLTAGLLQFPENQLVRADIGEIAPIGWVLIEYQPVAAIAYRSEALLNGALVLSLLAAMATIGWRSARGSAYGR